MTTKDISSVSNGHKPDHDVPKGESVAEEPQTPVEPTLLEPTTLEETTDVEPGESADSDAAATPERGRRRWVTRAVAAVLIAAVLGAGGFGGWLFYQQHQRDAAASEARHAAEKYAVVLTSIDTNAIDQNFTDVLNGSTGEFKDMYSKSSTQLRQLLLDNKAAARGTVLESAVQSVTPDRVVVLLFVDQSITNSAVPDPRIDRSRIKMTMDKVDGHWLASKVELP